MKTLVLILILIATCVSGSAAQGKTNGKAGDKLSQDDEIRAVVARQLIKDWPEATAKPSIAVESGDPSPELLKSLQRLWPALRPRSKCSLNGEDLIAPPGLQLEICDVRVEIGKLKQLDSGSVEVFGYTQISVGGFGIWGCTYLLERRDDHWNIAKTLRCTVS